MHAIKDIIGLPVVMADQCIGYVLQCETDTDLRRVQAVWISTGHGGSRRIPAADVVQAGERTVRVRSRGERRKARCDALFRRAISTDGTRIGAVIDAEIDDSLEISALWLTCGYPDDLLKGRSKIERYSVRKSDGAVLIPLGEEEFP